MPRSIKGHKPESADDRSQFIRFHEKEEKIMNKNTKNGKAMVTGFDVFTEMMRDQVKDILGEGYEVTITEVTKNNDTKYKGLTIRHDGDMIAPTIYMEQFWEDRLDKELKQIAANVVSMYMAHKEVPQEMIGIKEFLDFGWVKERLFYKLVNKDRNTELVKNAPHREVMDLMLVYGVHIGNVGGDSMGSVTIKNDHLETWGVTEEDLYEIAKENTPRLFEMKVWTMGGILLELGHDIGDADVPMFVLSNREKINGASILLYHEKLKELSDKLDSDLYILPSSIHEVIAIPTSVAEPDSLKFMIRSINDTEVKPEEVLSYSLYKYERETNKVSVA